MEQPDVIAHIVVDAIAEQTKRLAHANVSGIDGPSHDVYRDRASVGHYHDPYFSDPYNTASTPNHNSASRRCSNCGHATGHYNSCWHK